MGTGVQSQQGIAESGNRRGALELQRSRDTEADQQMSHTPIDISATQHYSPRVEGEYNTGLWIIVCYSGVENVLVHRHCVNIHSQSG